MNIKQAAFFGYPITDVALARQFYEGVLGLTAEMAEHFAGPDDGKMIWWIEYDLHGSTLAISDSLPKGSGGPVLALEVDDLDSWYQTLKAKGVALAFEVIDTPGCRFFGIQDPDHNALILHQCKAR